MKNNFRYNRVLAAAMNGPDMPARFHFRCETRIHDWCSAQSSGFERVVRRILHRFLLAVEAGLIDLHARSTFLSRSDITDKVETAVRMDSNDKDRIDKLALAIGSSQAEIARMALEWFMEAIWGRAAADTKNVALRKWHHRVSSISPVKIDYQIWHLDNRIIWQFPGAEQRTRGISILASGIC